METVTPVNSGEAKEVQQIQQQTSAQAIEVAKLVMELIEKLLAKLEKEDKDEEQNEQDKIDNQSSNHQSSPQKSSPSLKKKTSPNHQSSSHKDDLEITINGEKKLGGGTNKLTWSDYGKLQALMAQDVGSSHQHLAQIKVEKLTHKDGKLQRQTLLETDDQGTVLTPVAKPPQPHQTIRGNEAINRAVSQLSNGDLKTYLATLNQQMSQQFQQQEKVLEETRNQNLQLHQQLELSQAVSLTSQTMNLEYAKMLQQYQQAQQHRNQKDVKGWPNLIKHPVKSVQQWWLEKQQKWTEEAEQKKAAMTVIYLVKHIKEAQFSGTKYRCQRDGNAYQLKDQAGNTLLSFESQGLLGVKVHSSNLTPQQKDELQALDKGLRKEPTFLLKNPQFYTSSPKSEPIIPVSPQLNDHVGNKPIDYLDYQKFVKGIKQYVAQSNNDISVKNADGYDITTHNQGQFIQVVRSDNKELVVSQERGTIKVPSTSTPTDASKLNNLVQRALNNFQKKQQQNASQPVENSPNPQQSRGR